MFFEKLTKGDKVIYLLGTQHLGYNDLNGNPIRLHSQPIEYVNLVDGVLTEVDFGDKYLQLLDEEFRQEANSQGKYLGGLDLLGEQHDRVDDIYSHYSKFPSLCSEMDSKKDGIIEAFASMDIEKARSVVNEVMSIDPIGAELMIHEPNRKWMKKIVAESATTDRILVVCGHAHLCSEYSLQNLLKEEGWEQ